MTTDESFQTNDLFHSQLSALPLRVDFDMEMDEVLDELFAEHAEEFAGAVVAAGGGAMRAGRVSRSPRRARRC